MIRFETGQCDDRISGIEWKSECESDRLWSIKGAEVEQGTQHGCRYSAVHAARGPVSIQEFK